MSFELDDSIDLSRAKKVTLGTREFYVAPLLLRSLIALADMQPIVDAAKTTTDHIERLIDVAVLGLKRTYPALTRDDLLEDEITITQLRAAQEVIIEQGGGKKEATAPPLPTAGSA